MPIKKQEAPGVLKNHQHKVTGPRLVVLSVLSAAKEPLTIKEILAKTGKGEVNQATVYRIVNALDKSGLIKRIEWQHGHAHYELSGQKDHHHLVCLSCHRTEDVEHKDAGEMEKKVLRRSKNFASIEKHSLEFFGLCKSCQK